MATTKSSRSKTTSAASKSRSTTKTAAPVTPAASSAVTGAPKASTSAQGAQTQDALRLKDLVERVAERASVKPNQAKKVTKALLEELSTAIDEGRMMNLAGLGRLKVQRTIEKPNAKVNVLKLRRKTTS